MRFLLLILKPFTLFLTGLDRLLIYLAVPFSVHVTDTRKRFAILLGIYTVIYVVGFLPVPVLPLVALAVGYIGVLAVGRAWVLNEKERTLIAKKLKDGNPDEMPDLRWTALVSALQLLVLWPLIFMQVQRTFGLYAVPEGATFWTWMVFTLDSYNKAFLGLLQIYGVHFEEVRLDSAWGRHLVTLCRLTFDYLLIQGVFRLLAIRQTIGEAVQAVKNDTSMAVRIGKRAVRPLIDLLYGQDRVLRADAAKALGELGVVEPLLPLLKERDDLVRGAAVMALQSLEDVHTLEPYLELLLPLLQDEDFFVRQRTMDTLARLGDVHAVEPLLTLLKVQESVTQVGVARSLGFLGDARAIDPLLALIQDQEQNNEVRATALEAVGRLADARCSHIPDSTRCHVLECILPLLQEDDKLIRMNTFMALSHLGDARALTPLMLLLQDKDSFMRSHAAEALGWLGDVCAVESLLPLLRDHDDFVRSNAAVALGEVGDARAVEPLLGLLQDQSIEVRKDAAKAIIRLDPVAAAKAGLS